MKSVLEDHIIAIIREKGRITKPDLVGLIHERMGGDINEKTIAWRLHDMTGKGLITHLTRGAYGITDRKHFRPDISPTAKQLMEDLQGRLPQANVLCLTETAWINQWALHQSFANPIVVETEKWLAELTFRELRYQRDHVYYDPDERTMDLQLQPGDPNIIVKPIISEAPVVKAKTWVYSSLEKILVDLLCDVVYEPYREEAAFIFGEVFKTYLINQPRLRRYARRRSVENKVNELLHDHK